MGVDEKQVGGGSIYVLEPTRGAEAGESGQEQGPEGGPKNATQARRHG